MKNVLITAICLVALAMVACNNSGDGGNETSATADTIGTSDTTSSAQTSASDFTPQACFIRAVGQDTTWVGISMGNGNTIRGTYDWIPWEKDGARGTFAGTWQGQMVHVIYDYTIEGSAQKEEKIFKIVGSALEEAEGELQESPDGVLRLKDTTNLKFIPLTRVLCKK